MGKFFEKTAISTKLVAKALSKRMGVSIKGDIGNTKHFLAGKLGTRAERTYTQLDNLHILADKKRSRIIRRLTNPATKRGKEGLGEADQRLHDLEQMTSTIKTLKSVGRY